MKFEFDIEKLLRAIYAGKYSPFELPEELYFAIADYLKKGLYEGYGITFGELTKQIEKGMIGAFDKSDLALLAELRENVYIFSAAKTFQETLDFTGALIGEDGQVLPFKDFKERMLSLDEQYNQNWMRTEYDTAYGQAQNSVRWNEIEKNKEVLPLLRYSAIEDDRTSEICAPLDGVTLPVDDPFWDSFMPLNHFNCRCTVQQLDEDNTLTSEGDRDRLMESTGDMMQLKGQDLFKMNPGKDRLVFDGKHPYFEVDKKYKDFAKQNFGLPIPDTDE